MPFEVPEGWVWTTIEEICSKIGSGSTPRGSNYSTNGIPFFRSQNVYNDRLVYDDIKYISEEVHQKMKGTEVLANDLLLNITGGSLGRCAVVPADFNCGNVSQHVCIMRSVLVEPEYFHALVLSSYFAKSMKITGSGREGLPKYNLEQMGFPLPPLTEQQRIVAEIEHWFALLDQIELEKSGLQAIIKQTKSKILDLAIHGKLVPQDPNDEPAIELLKRINPGFTPCDNGHYTFKIPNSWTWCKLGDIAQSNIGLTYKPTDITDNGIPVYRSNNIRDRKIDKSDLVRVNAPILEKQFLNIGDLLICARNGSRRLVGKCAIIEELDEVTSFGAFMAVCRSEYNQWIFNLLNTTYFDRYLDDSNSTAINQVTQRMLLALHIPLPPLSEQQRIVQKIEELFSVLDNIQNALEV